MIKQSSFSILGFLTLLSVQVFCQEGIHPGYDLMDIEPADLADVIEPSGHRLLVGGIDRLSDGRLVVATWGVPGNVYILENVDSDSREDITIKRFAMGMHEVLGMTVVNDTIYIMQKGELTALLDTDNDGVADLYKKINDNFSTSESLLAYSYGVAHLNGSFYTPLSSDVMVGGYDFNPSIPGRAIMMKLERDGTSSAFAGGFRNPNGISIGFGDKIFAVDNQGSWLPACKLIHVQEGRFYGHRTNPQHELESNWFNSHQDEAPPMVWLTFPEASRNPGQAIYIPDGRYKGQMFFAESDERLPGPVHRIFIEEVNGELQGAILPFCRNLKKGPHRLVLGPDGTIYVGILGSCATGGWSTIPPMKPGLQRLKPNGQEVFEILAVRSTGPGGIELEFTQEAGDGAGNASNYTVVTWTHEPRWDYGGGNKEDRHGLTVNDATVSGDKKRVELDITGLQENHQVHITINNVTSSTGDPLWTTETWYTLNSFGPGTAPDVAGCLDQNYEEYDPLATRQENTFCRTLQTADNIRENGRIMVRRTPDGGTAVTVPFKSAHGLHVLDLQGRLLGTYAMHRPGEFFIPSSSLPAAGLYVIQVEYQGRGYFRKFAAVK